MRIEKLFLRDFRNHQDTKIDLDRFTFVIGPNACGKSSIAMAIEFLLTGKAGAVTDSGGRGADDLIRLGSREFYVAGLIGKTLVERSKSPKNHTIDIGGHSGPLSDMQDKIYEGAGVTGGVLSACLNSGRFLAMDEKAQKALLAQVLASEKIEIPQEITDLFRALDSELGIDVKSIADIDAIHKYLYDLRTETSRHLKSLGTVEKPAGGEEVPNYAETKAQLDALRKELNSLTARKAREEGRYDTEVQNVSGRRASLHAMKDAAEGRMLHDAEADRLQVIIDGRERVETLAGKIASFKQSIDKAQSEIRNDIATKSAVVEEKRRNLKEQITQKNLQVQGLLNIKTPECPTCLRALSAREKGAVGSKLDDELKALDQALVATDAEMPRLDVPEPESLAKLRKNLAKLENELAAIGDIAGAEAKMRAHREAIVESERCQRELNAIADPQKANVTDILVAIEELNGRIAVGEQVIDEVRALEQEWQLFRQWTEAKTKADALLAALAKLLDFFGPNGLKTRLMGNKIVPFEAAMNTVLDTFGYTVGFTLEPYDFWVREVNSKPGQDARRLKQLSESEAFRFGVALQIALAMATDLKFIVIDRADVLDQESREILAGMLLDSGLDQAIVLSTTDQPAPAELPAGVKFVQLGNQAVAA